MQCMRAVFAILHCQLGLGPLVSGGPWSAHTSPVTRGLFCRYGIMGIGGVCHTLNPRLFVSDLEYIVNHGDSDHPDILVDKSILDMMESSILQMMILM